MACMDFILRVYERHS